MHPFSDESLRGRTPQGPAALGSDLDDQIRDCNGADHNRRGHSQSRSIDRAKLSLPPEMSARSLSLAGPARWLAASLALSGLAAALAPGLVFPLMCAVIGLPFLAIAVLRIAALALMDRLEARQDQARQSQRRIQNPLPRYAVLVPLYRETAVLDQLIGALLALDFPVDRLQISLIVEEHDHPTREALAKRQLPAHMRIVVVPPGNPRTKPRALNYALADAVGDYVVVYDAEDMPEPDQLKRVLALYQNAKGKVGCVQARLGLYNPKASLLSRQFTIEYNALFGALLPVLAHLRLLVPLGGTSNHFPRPILEKAGGWDAFNVTEDADLGVRLARLGLEVHVVNSTTWEEAPETFRVWLCQRTRWLKGWMQTYLVHMRDASRLRRELGNWRYFGFQTLMCAMLFSALIHPFFYVLVAANLATTGTISGSSHASGTDFLFDFGILNLAVGYLSAIGLGIRSVSRQESLKNLAWHALAMPVYWLLISIAGYRALWQLAKDPFCWEKTPHKGRASKSLQ